MERSEIEIRESALSWPAKARAMVVTDDESCFAAGEALLGIKSLRAEVETVFGPIVTAAYLAHREATSARAKVDQPLTEAEVILKRSIAGYQLEQRRIAEEQDRLERERLERLAEHEREAEIEEAEADGASMAEIEEIVARPLAVPAMVRTAPQPVRQAGIAMRENWKAAVEDKLKLVRHCAANPEYLNLVDPNMTAINGIARSLKSAAKIPGVRVFNEPVIAAGRR